MQILRLFLLFLVPFYISAQHNKITFKVLGIEDGLSQNIITAVCQDKQGFLWIGTKRGLNRYDGSQTKIYTHKTSNSNSLLGDNIQSIYETQAGELWIGTQKGLSRYNRTTDEFEHYFPNPEDTDFQVFTIYEDRKNNLWIGANSGLYCLGKEYKKFSNYKLVYNREIAVRAIYEDTKGNIWAGTTQGLAKLNSDKKLFIIAIPNIIVQAITEDRNGKLWAGCTSGLHSIDLTDVSSKTQQSYWIQTPINTLAIDANDIMWIGSNKGLMRLDRVKNQLLLFDKDSEIIRSNYINCLYIDKQKTLWVGTYNGLHFTSPYFHSFTHFKYQRMQSNSITSDTVNCFLQDKKGQVWIGTANGLNRYDSLANTFYPYFQQLNTQEGLLTSNILSLYQDRQGDIWIGTDKGLSRFDTAKREFEHYLHEKFPTITIPKITSIVEDADNNLWIGTKNGELLCWTAEKRKNKEATFQFIKHFANKPLDMKIQYMIADKQYLWVAVYKSGLYRVSIQGKKIQELFRLASQINTDRNYTTATNQDFLLINAIPSTAIFCGMLVTPTNLLVGTAEGLHLLNTKTLEIEKNYTQKDGLIDNQVMGLVAHQQYWWISTAVGITRLDKFSGICKNFSIKTGLQDYDFNAGAALKTTGEEVYFGSNNGFSRFRLEAMKDNPYPPKVMITAFRYLNDKNIVLDSQIIIKKHVELQHADNAIFIRFAALHFIQANENKFAYMLEGFDKDWIESGNRNFANYTNIPSGNYVFKVKAANNDGVWSDNPATLSIAIHAPFWQKLWFWVLITCILLTILYTYFQIRYYQQRTIRKELEKQVVLRTKELQEQKNKVELINKNLEYLIQDRTKTLSKTIAENEQNLAELQQANFELDTFTYHASHDLKAPLSSILGLVQVAKMEHQPAMLGTYLDMIAQSVRKLDNLVVDLLALSRNKRTEIIHEPIDWLQEINDSLTQLQYMANFSQISITKNIVGNSIFYSDSKRIRVLLNNIISNAIKYQRIPEEHFPSIDIIVQLDSKKAVILITDNGEGIPNTEQERIFDMFVRATDKATGSGLGLYIAKSVANKLGGSITLQSVFGKGTSIEMILPNWSLS